MLRKTLITSGCAMFMAVAPFAQSASADKAGNEAIAAGVAGVALGVLGATLAKHHHHHGRDKYRKHPQVSNEENEIGQCMHRAHRALGNRGHSYVEFDHVVNYRPSEYQDSITLRVDTDGRHSNHTKQKNVTCVFSDGDIIGFNIRNH